MADKREKRLLLSFALLACVIISVQAQSSSVGRRFIAKFKNGATPELVNQLSSRLAAFSRTRSDAAAQVSSNALCGSLVTFTCSDQACVDTVKDMPEVTYVEEDVIVHASTLSVQEVSGKSWALETISKPTLMNRNGLYEYDYTGQGVNAYVLDTGIYLKHEEFEGRAKKFRSYTGSSCDDCNGHGTHVAGSVGGKTYGVAKRVNLLSVQVLDSYGEGYSSDVVNGLCDVVDDGVKPAVIVMSLGGSISVALDNAVEYANNNGFIIVVAAGNDDDDACGHSPARSPYAITVGSFKETGFKASTSNYGDCVKIWAPGERIRSAGIDSPTDTAIESGTSMATPHVAGVVALLLQQNHWLDFASILSTLQTEAKTQKMPDVYNTEFPEGSPMIDSLVYTSPCLNSSCTIMHNTISSSTLNFPVSIKAAGTMTFYVYARRTAGDTTKYSMSMAFQYSSDGSTWSTKSTINNSAASASIPMLLQSSLTEQDLTTFKYFRISVSRSNISNDLQLRLVADVPLLCTAATCHYNGNCAQNITVFTGPQCDCFKNYDGDYCEVDTLGMLSRFAMLGALLVGLIAAVVTLWRQCKAERKKTAVRQTNLVGDTQPLLYDEPIQPAYNYGSVNSRHDPPRHTNQANTSPTVVLIVPPRDMQQRATTYSEAPPPYSQD